ncbi:hypothetical protein SAMN05421820_11191 [Pedobacter steynii]|uniref:Uncharacterized protein n=1 Tax=Pedobacter steynii TaxID=430522 RepID=A0A1H0GAS6_9SPHI|nr:hypothetical protein [Pedobacter steynii]NQX42370.1 hypothetical protein [Pedobacter steynii]SDO03980.1 hypothetical protein SAMN05421820_11191 [Pedobacter steynii]
MKNNFYLFIIAFAMVTSSCKKQESSVKGEIKRDVELEGDHLAFKDYSTFVDYYKVVSGMDKSQRQQWEKSLNFTSMQTVYEHFNEELNELEKGSKENYFRGFSNLKEKYKGSLLFTEDSYRINNSGISEAILTSKNGFVKVGDDYLQFGEKGVTTYKEVSFQRAQQLSQSNLVSTESLELTAPQRNSFTSKLGEWHIINKERGRVLFRSKAYNLHSDALGYQSFAALEGRAEHLNIFGTWRGVGMALSLYRSPDPNRGYAPTVDITYQNLTNNLPRRESSGSIELKPNFFEGLSNVEHFDRVMCITRGLEVNPSAALSTVGGSGSQLLNYAVDAGSFSATDVYWKEVFVGKIKIGAMIQVGLPVIGNPAVSFDVFSIDGRSLVQNQ